MFIRCKNRCHVCDKLRVHWKNFFEQLFPTRRESRDDNAAVARSAKKLAELPCEVLCCGHGPVIRSGAGQQMHGLAQSL